MAPQQPFPQSVYTESHGLRLHHLDWGQPEKPTLVLLHGIRLHAHCWGDFCRRYADRYHILALDARGHGDSEWAKNEADYHLEDYYNDLDHVLKSHAPNGKVVLVGHSLGARTCMIYAHMHPERVEKMVLVDMGAGLPQAIGKKDFSRMTETPPPQDFASHAEATEYLAGILRLAPRDLLEESVVYGMRKLENGRFTWKYDPQLGGAPQPNPEKRNWDLWEAVEGIPIPTLLLHGQFSHVVSPEIAQRMAEIMPNCQVEQVENAGHALFTDQPQKFAEHVGAFLDA